MNTLKLSFGLFILTSIALLSCSKSSDSNVGGKGGNATLYVTLDHHELQSKIYDAKVYIKYNATDLPANNVWDDSVVCGHNLNDTSQTAIFTNLKNGNYYLYSLGQDSLWRLPVKGGLPYTISQQNTQNVLLGVDEY